MKHIIIAFIILFAGCSTLKHSIRKKTNLESEKLKGKVKEMKVFQCDYLNKNDSAKCLNTYSIEYNEKGNQTSFTFFYKGMVEEVTKYKYDEMDNNIEQHSYDKGDTLIYKYISKFNKKGQKLETENINADGTMEVKFIYCYDKNSNNLETKCFDKNGFYQSIKEKYDNDGNKLETNFIRGASFKKKFKNYRGGDWEKEVFKYDNYNNNIEDDKFKEDGNLLNKHIYKYDINANITEVAYYESDTMKNYIYTNSYEFDKTGNWIKRFFYSGNTIKKIINREITYFKD